MLVVADPAQVWDQVGDQVWAQVWGQVWDQVRAQVRAQVRDQVGEQVKMAYHRPLYLSADAGWLAFYDFFAKQGITTKSFIDFTATLANCGDPWEVICTEGAAIIVSRPVAVRRDNDHRLHSDQEPAIEWADGFKLWALRGVFFEYEIWHKIITHEFQIEDLMKIENADQRAVAVSFLRPDRLLKHVKAEHIHTGIKGTKLYKVPNFMDRGETEYCMTMVCPSTGRDFLEWVEPDIGKQGDADLAQASSFMDEDGNRLSVEDYLVAIEA